MHYNPCGRAVDWIQFPFEVDARLHRGAGAPLVRLRWVFTDMPFLPVGTGSIINNRIWNKDQISELEVGQLPVLESHFDQDARWRLPAGMVPGHMCNPQWFETGEPWPTTLPPAVYGLFWIPECCGLFQDAAEGGVQLGGAAGDVHRPPDATEGGVELGGEAGDEWELPSEVWEENAPGDYTFTPLYSGDYLIELWGGGGGGENDYGAGGGGGGGGGGGYSNKVVTLVAATGYAVKVGSRGSAGGGAGGPSLFEVTVVRAEGGLGGGAGTGGNGGDAASGVGTVKNDGGDGGGIGPFHTDGGGGGGSGALAGPGNPGTVPAGGVALTDGGEGGLGGSDPNGDGLPGGDPGGGGGAGSDAGGVGEQGGSGRARATFPVP